MISYSNSKLNTFQNCPRQYKFAYIEKRAVEKPVSVEAYLGDAVHRTLEKLYTLKMNARLQPLEETIDFYRKIWEGPDRNNIKVTRDNLGVDDYIRVGENALRKYYETYAPFEDGIALDLEKKFSFPLDNEGRFSISGKIDRISRRLDGVVEIIDYKTKASIPTQQNLDNDSQMGLYCLATKYLWPDFDKIELKQIFLRHGVSLKTMMNEEKLEEIKYQAFQRILEIEQARRDDNFSPRESALCDWCVYYELCPAKRHGLALEKEIDLELDAESGKELARKYLELDRRIKLMDSEKRALREDVIRFCEGADVTALEAPNGSLKIRKSVSQVFPSKSDDEKAYMEISFLVREAGIEECLKLDQNVLYKEFYAKEKLPHELNEKLQEFLREKREYRLISRHEEAAEEGEC